MIFAGVGLASRPSGTLVPLLLQQGLRESWYGLGALSALLTLISWTSWPKEGQPTKSPAAVHRQTHRGQSKTTQLRTTWPLLLEYGLNACALVPHMLFLVDFVARGLGQGIATGSNYWVFYGLGAIVGPLVTGHIADRSGFGPALRAAFLIEAIAVLLPAISTTAASLIVSSVVIGGFTPGIVPLVLGRIHELVPHSAEQERADMEPRHHQFCAVPGGSRLWLFLDATRAGRRLSACCSRLGGAAVALAHRARHGATGARKAAR